MTFQPSTDDLITRQDDLSLMILVEHPDGGVREWMTEEEFIDWANEEREALIEIVDDQTAGELRRLRIVDFTEARQFLGGWGLVEGVTKEKQR